MEKKQTEAFKHFINNKQGEVSDFLSLLGDCADKLEFLEDSLVFRNKEEFDFNERTIMGFARILGDVRADLRLLEADMAAECARDVAEFEKRRAEEKALPQTAAQTKVEDIMKAASIVSAANDRIHTAKREAAEKKKA